jgi:hypothetical protein
MEDLSRHEFPHRHNADGTCDSICPVCFRTVETRRIEAFLHRCEEEHVCREPVGILSKDELRHIADTLYR